MSDLVDLMQNDVSQYCGLVIEINTLASELRHKRAEFYYGGYAFEEINELDLLELSNKQIKLKALLKDIIKG